MPAQSAAFFDVDNTLLRGASLFYLARGLHLRNFIATRDILRAGWRQLTFRVGGAEHMDHMAHTREQALAFIAGWSVKDLTELAEEILTEALDTKLWPGTHELAQQHLDAGEPVWLVTAAPVELARLIAAHLGLTGALGTVAETRDGYYTGRLVGELLHGGAKAVAVRKLAATDGFDLSRCSAYSDSYNDLPMLSLVGHPCAINPDRRLARYARMHGWRTQDFRRGRRAVRLGMVTAGAAGLAAGAVALARRRTSSKESRRKKTRSRE